MYGIGDCSHGAHSSAHARKERRLVLIDVNYTTSTPRSGGPSQGSMNAKCVGEQEKKTQAGRRSVVVHIVSNTQNSSKSRPVEKKNTSGRRIRIEDRHRKGRCVADGESEQKQPSKTTSARQKNT
jgi:hypothetical protein